MSKFKDWVMEQDIDSRRKLIEDYMAKCPFIEFHEIKDMFYSCAKCMWKQVMQQQKKFSKPFEQARKWIESQ